MRVVYPAVSHRYTRVMNRKQRRAGRKNGNGMNGGNSGSGNGGGGNGGGGPHDAILEQAMALHQTGRLVEADGYYRQILERDPTHRAGLRLRGALAFQLGNPGVAVELLSEARKQDPKNPEVYNLLGLAFEGAGNSNGAEQAYRHALRLDPRNAEVWSNLGALLRDAGKLSEAAEALGKAVVLQPDLAVAYRMLGVTLTKMEKMDAALAAFETGMIIAPDDTDMVLDYGVALSTAGRTDEAAACFRDVLVRTPTDPDALTNLAATQLRLEDLAGAEETARQALALAPDSAGAMANLAMILSAAREFDEAEPLYHQALRGAPDMADIWSNFGNMLMAADRLEEAGVAYDKAMKLAPADARHAFQAGIRALNMGDLPRGWALYESGLECGERVPAATAADIPRWEGQVLDGTLLIVPEQGLGDEIRNLSCLSDAIEWAGPAARVVVGCDPRLSSLVQRAFPTVETAERNALMEIEADAMIPSASLPMVLRRNLDDFPHQDAFSRQDAFLCADPDKVAALRNRIDAAGSGMVVGLAWRSGLRRIRSAHALSALAQWRPVFDMPDIHLVSLQYGATAQEVAGTPMTLFEDLDLTNDLEMAAALSGACDLVINMGTSVGDMAGAIGVPVWSLMLKPDWTTLGADRHPFYPRTEIFWRLPYEDWSTVIDRVAETLKTLTRP